MKKLKKVLASAMVLTAFATTSKAQSTDHATATATVVTPISIVKNVDMSFGNIAVGATGGTVVLKPDGTRDATGGVTLPATAGTVKAAEFTVTGSDLYTYAITLPSNSNPVTLAHTNSTDNMTADNFTSTPSGTGTLTSGTQDVQVGATLHVAAGQAAGVYTSGNFDVTVNYN